MAGISGESTWPAIRHANIDGTYCALEAARLAGVPRVVLASSNHATGYTPRPGSGLLTEADAPPRPDTYYGVAKVTMEALGSLYADRYGLDVVCLRIGSAFAEPTSTRHLSTWLSPSDTVVPGGRRAEGALPRLRRRLGRLRQHPPLVGPHRGPGAGLRAGDDAEVYAEALIEVHGEPDLTDPVHARVGGEYTLPEFDTENFEPPAPRADIAPGSGVR